MTNNSEKQFITNIRNNILNLNDKDTPISIESRLEDVYINIKDKVIPIFLHSQRAQIVKLTLSEQKTEIIEEITNLLKTFIAQYEEWANDKEGYTKKNPRPSV